MSGARKLLLSGAAVTALLVFVAIASHAHRPGGGTSPADTGLPLDAGDIVERAAQFRGECAVDEHRILAVESAGHQPW